MIYKGGQPGSQPGQAISQPSKAGSKPTTGFPEKNLCAILKQSCPKPGPTSAKVLWPIPGYSGAQNLPGAAGDVCVSGKPKACRARCRMIPIAPETLVSLCQDSKRNDFLSLWMNGFGRWNHNSMCAEVEHFRKEKIDSTNQWTHAPKLAPQGGSKADVASASPTYRAKRGEFLAHGCSRGLAMTLFSMPDRLGIRDRASDEDLPENVDALGYAPGWYKYASGEPKPGHCEKPASGHARPWDNRFRAAPGGAPD